MAPIQSKIVGILISDGNVSESWESEPFPIPFFDNEKIKISFEDSSPEFIQEADKTLAEFLKLDKAYRDSVSLMVFNYYKDVGSWNEEVPEINIEDIWKHVNPQIIFPSEYENNKYVIIECSCTWEQEHGLQLVFKEGKALTRASMFDGHWEE
jgi:hypothetical protein